MPSSSRLRTAARVLVVFCLAGSCAGAATAHSVAAIDPAAITPAPIDMVPDHAAPQASREPFGLVAINVGSMAAKWRRLQPAIQLETQVLALCRADPAACTPAAARFLAVIDAAQTRDGRARIGTINRAVNLAIRPQSDPARFGVRDVWSTPLMTFAAGAGDCEDYAIAKYVALRAAGIADQDLRLVILHDRRSNEDHAVVAARVDDAWLILDNRRMVLLTDVQFDRVTPLLALRGGTENPPMLAGQQPVAAAVLAGR